jgi:organic hydroperoxide reductase OsmC/OhrA
VAIFKDHRFSSAADWVEGERVRVSSREKPTIDVVVPPELGGPDAVEWSSEELLLAACASSYELTLLAVAENAEIPIHSLQVRTTGHVTRCADGILGFVVVELDVDLVTSPDRLIHAEAAAMRAKEVCIVTNALDVPVHLRVNARAEAELEAMGVR